MIYTTYTILRWSDGSVRRITSREDGVNPADACAKAIRHAAAAYPDAQISASVQEAELAREPSWWPDILATAAFAILSILLLIIGLALR